jgi:KAP family P-loop domain
MGVETSREQSPSDPITDGTALREYFLLNDQPVDQVEDDPLGMADIAAGIASVLAASVRSSPFVLAVDAGWGMGKSTLLRQIENHLADNPQIIKLRYNAWTAEGGNALEGLIKAVLGELDRNVLRRWVRKLARQQRLMGIAWLAFGAAARFFGVTRMVDELWSRLAVDAKSRNELRGVIHGMLSDWISATGVSDPDRALVVFIDDLDRCSDEVVVKICEAVKLYLDAPGLIFVIACDQSVLARGVASSARGGTGEGRSYLEKIIQVAYRMPPPDEEQIRKLIDGYARESGTDSLINKAVADILAEGTGRNPRRIKRIINSFVLEHRLDSAWRKRPLSSVLLVTAIVLQHLHAPFYELLVSEKAGENPIGEFLDYVRIREMRGLPTDGNDPWWTIVRRSFNAHRLQAPESPIGTEKLEERLKQLEGQLPGSFVALANNTAFIALLQGVEASGASDALRAQLARRPLATVSVQAGLTSSELMHLKNLHIGSTSNYHRSELLQTELRRLRSIGLITSKLSISAMPDEFDLSEWVVLTSRGENYIRRWGE